MHKFASPAERDRLRRWLGVMDMTVDDLEHRSAVEHVRLVCLVSRDEKRVFARAAGQMGVGEAALFRGLIRSAVRDNTIATLWDYCATNGVDTADTPVGLAHTSRIVAEIKTADANALHHACLEYEVTKRVACRALVLAFIARLPGVQ